MSGGYSSLNHNTTWRIICSQKREPDVKWKLLCAEKRKALYEDEVLKNQDVKKKMVTFEDDTNGEKEIQN